MGSITRKITFGVVALGLLAGVAGCSLSDDKESSAATVPPPGADAAPAATAAAATTAARTGDESVALSGSGGAAPTPQVSPIALDNAGPLFGSALAITASVTVEVPDVRQAVIDLPELVTAKGGAVFDSQVAVGNPQDARATVTVKVRPQDLENLISGLGGLGELTARTQDTEDVTDQLADTESRIATAQASVDRVRELLAGAVDLDDVVKIENELTIRETALEQLLATQRNITDRVQLATLTIVLVPQPAPIVAVAKHDDGGRSVGEALRTGWNAFVTVVHTAVLAVAYIAPLLVLGLIGGVVALAVTRLRRRSHRGAPATPGS